MKNKIINVTIRYKDDSSSRGFIFCYNHPLTERKTCFSNTFKDTDDNVMVMDAWDKVYEKALSEKSVIEKNFPEVQFIIKRESTPQKAINKLLDGRKNRGLANYDKPNRKANVAEKDADSLVSRLSDMRRARAFFGVIVKHNGYDVFKDLVSEINAYNNNIKDDMEKEEARQRLLRDEASKLLLKLEALGVSVDYLNDKDVKEKAKQLKQSEMKKLLDEKQKIKEHFGQDSKPLYRLNDLSWDGDGEMPQPFKDWMKNNEQVSLELLNVRG